MYWLTGILGLGMLLAPFVFNFVDNPAALWTSLILGVFAVGLSFIEAVHKDASWEYWVVEGVGLLAIIAPFVFGFNTHANAMWVSIVAGVVLVAVAGSKLLFGQTETT